MVALTLQPALIAQQRKGGHLLGRPQWRPRRAAAAQCSCQCRQEQAVAAPRSPAQRLLSGAAALAASAALAFAPLDVATLPAHAQLISNDNPVVDLARVVPESKEHELAERIKALESSKGYRVRLLTRYGQTTEVTLDELRKGWNTSDPNTITILVDPSATNIMSFNYGLDVQKTLRRPFFTELQSRYGNLFYVRDLGESQAVLNMMDTLLTSLENPEACIEQGGCRQVPGVSADMYFFTLGTSIAGGLVVGFVDKLEPQGWVQRKWVWQLLFLPLWGTLFVNFGLGPIVSRTSDLLPVLGNCAGFAGAAALVILSPKLARATGLTSVDISGE